MKFPAIGARLVAGIVLASTGAVAAAQNLAIVNGKPLPKSLADEMTQALVAQGRPDTPELRQAVREQLIARELFIQEAERRGLTRSDDVRQQLENARRDILIRALIRAELTGKEISDADVKAEYERFVKLQGGKEYRARHVLVETEAEAKSIIEDLKKGTAFEELAKRSKDPGSAQSGGDLDWNAPGAFVKEFSDAMVALAKGKFSDTPVKTQFGYHVIRLDDVRDTTPPPFDQVQQQVRQELERRRIQELQQALRAKAKIE